MQWLENIRLQWALRFLAHRGFHVTRRLGMTLAGNAFAIRRKDGSFIVHLQPGCDHVTLLWGSQLVDERESNGG